MVAKGLKEEFLTGVKRKAEGDTTRQNKRHPNAMARNYDEARVALGFAVTTIGRRGKAGALTAS